MVVKHFQERWRRRILLTGAFDVGLLDGLGMGLLRWWHETSDLVGSFPLKFPGVKRTSKLISIPFIIPVLSQYYPIIIPSLSSKSWSWFQPVQRSAGGFAMEVSMLAMDSPNGGKRVVFWGNDDPIFRAPGLIAKFNKNNSNNYGLYVSDTQATIVNWC